jgi:hypothetical protein
VLKILDVEEIEDPYKPNETLLQAKILDAKTNQERIWNIRALGAINQLKPFIMESLPTRAIRVWTIGTDKNTRYYAKSFNESSEENDDEGDITSSVNDPILETVKKKNNKKKQTKKVVKSASKKPLLLLKKAKR